jgi:hypothetical protein
MTEDASLTGLWHGLYHYPALLAPVFFTATVISHGSGFSGSTTEVARSFGDRRARKVSASLRGRVGEGAVSFLKTYDGTGGWRHAVTYEGRLSADRTEIEGSWHLPSDWRGRFLMVRAGRMDEAELRRAFAQA